MTVTVELTRRQLDHVIAGLNVQINNLQGLQVVARGTSGQHRMQGLYAEYESELNELRQVRMELENAL